MQAAARRVQTARPSVHSRFWWSVGVALTLLAIVACIALAGHRRHNPHLDVFDEGSHYAYVVALRSGHVPAWGDRLTPQERKLDDCLQAVGTPPAPCGSRPAPASSYPAGGYDYEAQQPPLGYLPYVVTANPQASPVAAITAARHGGMIWAAISGALLLAAAALEEFSLLGLSALLATCLLNPVFTYATGTVNNDAAGVAAGAAALIAWSLSRRRPRWSLWLGVTAGLLLGLTKGVFVVVPFALVVGAAFEERRHLLSWNGLVSACRRHGCVLAMLVATAASYGAFIVVQNVRATVPSSTVLQALLGFSKTGAVQPSAISDGLISSLTLFQPYYAYDALNVVWGLCAFGVLAGIWFLRISEPGVTRLRGLSLGIALGMLALVVGWPILVYVQGRFNFAASVRYCVPLLPLIAYVIVTGCRRFGVLVVGLLLPVACAILQLGIAKY